MRAVLEAWRPFVDEIVLALDARGDMRAVTGCADLADRILIAPPVNNMERYLGWLHRECRGDWILRADDDELPSAALVEALPSLLTDPEPTHYWLPRRWSYPDPGSYISSGLWLRDIQVRLVRNLPGIWSFAGPGHSNIVVLGSGRIVDAPLIHVVTLLSDLDARRRKAEWYEQDTPGMLAESGLPLWHLYTPEDEPSLVTAALPDADRATVARFLDRRAAAQTIDVPARLPPTVPIEEIERWLDDRTTTPDRYACAVSLVHPLPEIRAGRVYHVQASVTNRSADWWPRGPEPSPAIALGHYWTNTETGVTEAFTPRTPFPERVGPGCTTRMTVALAAPTDPGRYELSLDVVHEWVRWFDGPATHLVDVREN